MALGIFTSPLRGSLNIQLLNSPRFQRKIVNYSSFLLGRLQWTNFFSRGPNIVFFLWNFVPPARHFSACHKNRFSSQFISSLAKFRRYTRCSPKYLPLFNSLWTQTYFLSSLHSLITLTDIHTIIYFTLFLKNSLTDLASLPSLVNLYIERKPFT